MKLRTLLAMVIGIVVGYLLANKLREDDPDIVTGPQRSAANSNGSNPALKLVSSGAQQVLDVASTRGLDAIRRARGAIQARIGTESFDDDATWG